MLNSVAGGGGFIAFPALIFSGIAPISANATNKAALWPGTVASTVAYRKVFTSRARRLLPPLIVVGLIGGTLGAHILVRTPPATFLHLIAWLLLSATLVFVFSGRLASWIRTRVQIGYSKYTANPDALDRGKTPPLLLAGGLLAELLLTIYMGYFGAGAGIPMLALLALLGMENIHTMNGVKTLLVSLVNGTALITFILGHMIAWPEALVMVAGAAGGGYAGAHFAQKMNPQHVRWIVIAVGFSMSAYFFVRYR